MEKKTILIASIFIGLILAGCSNKDKLPSGTSQTESDSTTYAQEHWSEEVVEMEGTDVFKHNVQSIISLKEEIEKIKSPSRLAVLKSQYKEMLGEATKDFLKVNSEEELEELKEWRKKVNDAFAEKCQELEIPPAGVTSTLKNLTDKLSKVHSKSDMETFLDKFRIPISHLDIIHLQVNDNSSEIGKIKEMSEKLKKKIEEKKEQYGVK